MSRKGTTHAAVYKEQRVKAYRGIPTIEALPLIKEDEKVLEKFTSLPAYDKAQRDAPPEERKNRIFTGLLWEFYQPFKEHLLVSDMLERTIRQGYIGRNPSGTGDRALMGGPYAGQFDSLEEDDKRTAFHVRKAAQGGSILGLPGVGKSSAVERYLATIPQKIVHTAYKDTGLILSSLYGLNLIVLMTGLSKSCAGHSLVRWTLRWERTTTMPMSQGAGL